MFAFGRGLHQENEQRLNDAGSPRALENLVRTKNGRLQARRDYETIAMTGTGSSTGGTGALTNLRLYDIAEYSGRLLGFGRADYAGERTHATDGIQHVFELLERATGNWRRAPTAELPNASQARLVGRIGRKPSSVVSLDIAATGGLVCMVFQVQTLFPSDTTETVGVHVFDPATDTTIFTAGINDADRPRVVAVSGSFFISYVVTSTQAVALQRFTPASDTALAALTSPVAAGAAIRAWDMSPGNDTATFWIAVARTGATTQLRGLNNVGTVTYTVAGPAVLYDGISIFNQTTAGTNRTHVVGVANGTGNVDLYSYIPPAGAPALTSLVVGGLTLAIAQVGLAMDPDPSTNPTAMHLTVRNSVGANQFIFSRGTDVVTHAAAGAAQIQFVELNSKPLVVNSRSLLGALIQEEVGFFTHCMIRHGDNTTPFDYRPVAVFDRFLGHQLTLFHLPQIAHDTSTGLTYMVVSTEDSDRRAAPQVLEIKIASTDRRQTVQLGDVLYIAGSVLMAYDGRVSQEAGGFLTRPFIATFVNAAGGALDLLGTYQGIAVNEFRDAKNRRIQSAPSNLAQFTLAGVSNAIQEIIRPSFTFRDIGTVDAVTPRQLQQGPTLSLYRTLNVNNGNGTFQLDVSAPCPQMAQHATVTAFLIQSDVALSDEPILYTQGARGALSGPLEFVCPDSCGTLAASADRILTGQLPNDSQIQESRPLFPGEQAQWNDTPGFYRDIRNRMLAVWRLDERRILWSATEIFECDGPGVDDNGLGDLGAPRRLPSDVGLYGGILGWRSMVEMSAGVMFQGLPDQIYLLPRGGVTPVAIGGAVEDTLAAYPTISAAVYMNEDQTVRFCCNNLTGTESVILLFDVRFGEWFVEGPYAFAIRSAARAAGRFYLLTSLNTLLRQRNTDIPLAFVAFAHRGSPVHGGGPGMFYDFDASWIYGTYNGNFQVRSIVKYDERDTETSEWVDIIGRTAGSQFVHRFGFDQRKCESVTVDFEVRAFQGQAVQGPHLTYWAIEGTPCKVPNQVGPEDMS